MGLAFRGYVVGDTRPGSAGALALQASGLSGRYRLFVDPLMQVQAVRAGKGGVVQAAELYVVRAGRGSMSAQCGGHHSFHSQPPRR